MAASMLATVAAILTSSPSHLVFFLAGKAAVRRLAVVRVSGAVISINAQRTINFQVLQRVSMFEAIFEVSGFVCDQTLFKICWNFKTPVV